MFYADFGRGCLGEFVDTEDTEDTVKRRNVDRQLGGGKSEARNPKSETMIEA